MILHQPRNRPEAWATRRNSLRHSWTVPFLAIEWSCEWLAFLLSRWSFLEVLEYLGNFSILIAVIFYFSESGDRLKQKHYQAWQVINTAQSKGGSGGRVEALQELHHDGIPLVGVDVSGAFLQGIQLPGARLTRVNFNAVDARNSNFRGADFTAADLQSANLRGSNLSSANFENANLSGADFCSTNLARAVLDGATLDDADLGNSDLRDVAWKKIKSLKGASIQGVRNAPAGFLEWAAQQGAVTAGSHSGCP
jgi:hypothetical protein